MDLMASYMVAQKQWNNPEVAYMGMLFQSQATSKRNASILHNSYSVL